MAKPKIFVSSTCYDLSTVRAQLKRFIESLGYEAVLSEYGDVVYDYRQHTHTSCVTEVGNCDVLVVIIGGRFGGAAVEEAQKEVDAAALVNLMEAWTPDTQGGPEKTEIKGHFSITQLEVVRALQLDVPFFILVEGRVWHDLAVYNNNPGTLAKDIQYPSLQKQETATRIFEFVNFLRRRKTSNSVCAFNTIEEAEDYLRKQWAGLFQRLLAEQRRASADQQALTDISQQIADIQAVVLSAVQDDKKKVASTVLKHRTVLEVAFSLARANLPQLAASAAPWNKVLGAAGITQVRTIASSLNQRGLIDRLVLEVADGTFWRSKYGSNKWNELENAWDDFIALDEATRKTAAETVVGAELEARMLTKDARQLKDVFPAGLLDEDAGGESE